MSYFAVPKDGVIINTIVALSKEDADFATNVDCIEFTYDQPLSIGSVYSVEHQTWFPPIVIEPVAPAGG